MPFDHFNLIAGFYDRAAQFILTEPLLGLLSLSSNSILLDAGGGTGRVAAALRCMVREVVVADLSHGMLRHAAEKDLATVRAPVESLPFPSGTFDRVVMMDALHHVLDQSQTARERWRVLAPGGRVVIIEPDIRKFTTKMLAIVEKLLLMRSHFLSAGKITSLFINPNAKTGVIYDKFNLFFVGEKVRRM